MAIGFTRDGVGSDGGLAVHQRTLKDTLSLTREKKSRSHKRCFTLGKVYSVYHFLHTSSRIVRWFLLCIIYLEDFERNAKD